MVKDHSDGRIFVLKIRIGKIRGKLYYSKKEFPEYIKEIEFENNDIISFVIEDFIETRSMFSVIFDDRVFQLQKSDPKKTNWWVEDGIYDFTLCLTAKDAWNNLRGFLYELTEERKRTLEEKIKGTEGEWQPAEEGETK